MIKSLGRSDLGWKPRTSRHPNLYTRFLVLPRGMRSFAKPKQRPFKRWTSTIAHSTWSNSSIRNLCKKELYKYSFFWWKPNIFLLICPSIIRNLFNFFSHSFNSLHRPTVYQTRMDNMASGLATKILKQLNRRLHMPYRKIWPVLLFTIWATMISVDHVLAINIQFCEQPNTVCNNQTKFIWFLIQ